MSFFAALGGSAMTGGNVKWFDTKKGYGFIHGPAGKDVFVHYTSIEGDGFRSLREGEQVDYELVETDKGLAAAHVRPHQEHVLEGGHLGPVS
jgi:CspA family cold shock protein